MDNYVSVIPVEFWMARKAALESVLEGLPVVKKGRHRAESVLRVYTGKHKCIEILANSPKAAKALEVLGKRKTIQDDISLISNILSSYAHKEPLPYKIVNTDNCYDSVFYDKLKDSSCSIKKDSRYYYNGRQYRSRAEMLFATLLDELGIEFKYDVKLVLDGREYTFDFVLLFREFNRCVFIEFFGRCDDRGYNRDKGEKMEHAFNDGIYIGRDLFIMSGDIIYMPGTTSVRIFLISIIAQLVEYHMVRGFR